MLYSIIVGLNNKAVSLYQELGSLQISSLLVRNALTGDATLIESFIFLEKKEEEPDQIAESGSTTHLVLKT